MSRSLWLVIVLAVLAALSLMTGVSDFSTPVLLLSRIPRTVGIMLTGMGLSISGLILQRLMQNPFVSPGTTGSLEAAKLGILLTVLMAPHAGSWLRLALAAAMTFACGLLYVQIINSLRYRTVIMVPLVGIIFGSILEAFATFLGLRFNVVQNMTGWLVGDFSSLLSGRYEVIYLCLPPLICCYLFAGRFTIAGMGVAMTTSLGLSYRQIMGLGLLLTSLCVSVIVVTVGTIPFVGLIVPNVVSMLYGDDVRHTLWYNALLGSIFLLLCDVLCRTVIYPYEVPVGLVAGLLGGALFLVFVLRRQKR